LSAVVDPRTGRILGWKDEIPLRYEYTAGVAGEAFLRGLKEGRILASGCHTCGEVRLPPRAYCLECYGRTHVDVEIYHLGRIAAISTPRRGGGGVRRAAPSATFGFVTFEGVRGGLLHMILRGDGRAPRIGDAVRPRFLPPDERKGSILDLQGFMTLVRREGGKR
jgi:uncharacterized protein